MEGLATFLITTIIPKGQRLIIAAWNDAVKRTDWLDDPGHFQINDQVLASLNEQMATAESGTQGQPSASAGTQVLCPAGGVSVPVSASADGNGPSFGHCCPEGVPESVDQGEPLDALLEHMEASRGRFVDLSEELRELMSTLLSELDSSGGTVEMAGTPMASSGGGCDYFPNTIPDEVPASSQGTDPTPEDIGAIAAPLPCVPTTVGPSAEEDGPTPPQYDLNRLLSGSAIRKQFKRADSIKSANPEGAHRVPRFFVFLKFGDVKRCVVIISLYSKPSSQSRCTEHLKVSG